MEPLLTQKEMRFADDYAIQHLGIPASSLMEKAAEAVAGVVLNHTTANSRGVLLAGPGNNGGDAIAVARLLHPNRNVKVFQAPTGAMSALCKEQVEKAKAEGVGFTQTLEGAQWAVDGLFGTGLTREISGEIAEIVKALNALKLTVFAIDGPSGLSGDTGQPLGACVRATHTICISHYKRGLMTGEAANWVGALQRVPIGIPKEIPGLSPEAFWYQHEEAKTDLPKRLPAGHKGKYGHLYVWAGPEAMEGAAALGCVAGFRTGVGKITLLGGDNLKSIQRRLPIEVMARQTDGEIFSESLETCVIGPGMGLSAEAWEVLQKAIESNTPLVLDADALTLVAQHEGFEGLCARNAPTVLTPHPKEASRLLGVGTETIQKDRFKSAKEIATKTNSTVLLKGKGTLIAEKDNPIRVVTVGDGSLSKAGSGDVLSGVIGAFLAQGLNPFTAATLGAYVHGRAGELLSQRLGTERSAMASELTDTIPGVFRELEA